MKATGNSDPTLSTGQHLDKAFTPKYFNTYNFNSYLGHLQSLMLAFWIHTVRNKKSFSPESY